MVGVCDLRVGTHTHDVVNEWHEQMARKRGGGGVGFGASMKGESPCWLGKRCDQLVACRLFDRKVCDVHVLEVYHGCKNASTAVSRLLTCRSGCLLKGVGVGVRTTTKHVTTVAPPDGARCGHAPCVTPAT